MAKQKGLPTHRRLAALCTQIQPAMLEGTDLTRIRQASSPSRHSAKRKRAGRGRAAQVMLPAGTGKRGKSADSTALTRTGQERSGRNAKEWARVDSMATDHAAPRARCRRLGSPLMTIRGGPFFLMLISETNRSPISAAVGC